MTKALDYLYAMKCTNEQMGQEPISIYEAIEELEDLQNRSCDNCKHFSTGKQPDGFNWNKCEYNFECKTCFNDYFEKVEK